MIYDPPSINGIQKTLDAQLLSGITASMTLNNVTGIQDKPGVCVVDLIDANGKFTPAKREYISFTGVSGNTLTGLTRNADSGGSDQDHAVGAIVQFPADVLQQQALIDFIRVQHNDDGTHKSALVTTLKATGAVVNTGTSDTTIVTPKALADSDYAKTSDITVTADSTTTFSNKRNQKRVYSTTSTATLTPEIDTYDIFRLTAQGGALTIANHSTSTPANGEMMLFEITDDGTGRAISFGTNYVAYAGVDKPTTTTANKLLTMLFIWVNDLSKWNLLASGVQG